MTPQEIDRLAQADVQDFIFSHEHLDVAQFMLNPVGGLHIHPSLLASQLLGRLKAAIKIPRFHRTRGVVYPPSLNLEQSSSEATAQFKTEWLSSTIPALPKIVDLTGGWGIDSYFFSLSSSQVDYIEPDENLLRIARHNHQLLQQKNIHHTLSSAEDFLDSAKTKFSLLYLDPSRRDENSKKVIRLADCRPQVVSLLPKLFERSNHILIKASPRLDIHAALRELVAVKKVAVVSVANECRELLFLLEKNYTQEPQVDTFNLTQKGRQEFSFHFSDEKKTISSFAESQEYIYEPNASVLKAGCFKWIGKVYALNKIQANTHLYTSSRLVKNFPGRVFKVEAEKFNIRLTDRANLIARNYPLPAEELKKKLKLKDGGNYFVLAFSGRSKKYIVLATPVG